jgi:uncharacterized OsmC-like protein
MLKSKSVLQGKFTNRVDNQRGHEILSDLGPELQGENKGATPLEFVVMAVSSCTTTIFKLLAQKMNVQVDAVEAYSEADKPEPMGSITAVRTNVRLRTAASEEELQKVLEQVKKNCPVGHILERAGIPHDYTIETD